MSQASQLSRYRPAIFVITGAAAACGIYILYTTFSSQPAKGGLHRSNAVHRRRPSPRFSVDYTTPTYDYFLGTVVVSKGDTKHHTDVNMLGAPTVSQIRSAFPDVPESEYPQSLLDSKAIESVLNACFLAQDDETQQARLREAGVHEISEAMQARNIPRLLSLVVPLLHQIVETDVQTINVATVAFLAHSGLTSYRRADVERPTDPQTATNDETGHSEVAETLEYSGLEDTTHEPEQGLKGLLYHIAETDAKRKAYEHRGIHCEECGEKPIRGVRWHCLNCPDFDLCSTCEASTVHHKTHVFAKVKIPLPVLSQPTQVHPVWYPGEPRKIWHALSPEMKTCFRNTYEFDEPHIDAYFDQFTCLANVPWKDDPAQIKAAIDRRAFNKALTCERWPQRFRPNAVYDRMFAFYDTDANDLIGFREFLNGIAYLRGPKRFTPLRRALQGFDIDSDGFVDRNDFLRLLRAKLEIQMLLIKDMVEGQELEQTQAAMETLRSSQPISSIFSWEEIPQGENRVPIGKARDANGDLQPLEGTKTILEDNEGWSKERAQRQRQLPSQSHEQLQHHLSRFEELLSSPTDGANSYDEGPSLSGAASDEPVTVNGTDNDPPLDEDMMWQIIEEGLNELLSTMFDAKETEHNEVINARPEIERWSKEIEAAMKRKEELRDALQKELQEADTVDPLLATAVNSLNGSVEVKPKDEANAEASSSFKSDIVPTDHESLTKREEEIAQKPLDELLSATGYSTIEQSDTNGHADEVTETHQDGAGYDSDDSVRSAESDLKRFMGLDGYSADSTMPQNRPNALPPTPQSGQGLMADVKRDSLQSAASDKPADATTSNEPPSPERLEHLGKLAEIDKEIQARGGPGRLSYDEVEAMVQNDSSKELRGIVTGWLEWASF